MNAHSHIATDAAPLVALDTYSAKWIAMYRDDFESFTTLPVRQVLPLFDALCNAQDALLGVMNQPRCKGSKPLEFKPCYDYIEKLHDNLGGRIQAMYEALPFITPKDKGEWQDYYALIVKYHALLESQPEELEKDLRRLFHSRMKIN